MSMTENEALKLIKSLVIDPKCELVKTFDFKATVIKALEELQQYRAIGTIEEFKDLKEKSEPKKIKYEEYCGFSDPVCSECKRDIDSEDKYCRWCGQALKT